MKKLMLIIALSYSLFAELKEVNADTLIQMQKQRIPLIDIRTPQEWKDRGIIKGAHKIMFFTSQGGADVPNFMFKLGQLVKDKEQPFIIYCAHANRTKELGKWLTEKLEFKKVFELKGGIEYGWIDKGLKTVKGTSNNR